MVGFLSHPLTACRRPPPDNKRRARVSVVAEGLEEDERKVEVLLVAPHRDEGAAPARRARLERQQRRPERAVRALRKSTGG